MSKGGKEGGREGERTTVHVCTRIVSVGSWEDHVLAHQLEDERPKGENTAQLPSTFSQVS